MKFCLRNKREFLEFARGAAAVADGYSEVLPTAREVVFPQMGDATAPMLAAALMWDVRSVDGTKCHSVAISYSEVDGGAGFYVSCGDAFLTGRLMEGVEEARSRAASCLSPDNVGLADAVVKRLYSAYGIGHPNSPCGFWRTMEKDPESYGCKHVRHLLACLGNSLPSLLTEIREAFNQAAGRRDGEQLDEVEPTLGERLKSYVQRDCVRRIPVMIDGPKGGGKTTAAMALRKDFDHVEIANCTRSMEAFDFIGGMMPVTGNQYVWMDGPIASAFRAAAAGKKTLLIVEELLRSPRRERDLFITALDPQDGCYRLRTGRPVTVDGGIARMEELLAPMANLAIVATSNRGGEYDIEEDDEAGAERWLYLHHNPGESFLRQILTEKASEYGHPPATICPKVDALIQFYRACLTQKTDGLLSHSPSLRILVRVLSLASVHGGLRDLRTAIEASIYGLVERNPDGGLNDAQVIAVRKAVSKVFAAVARTQPCTDQKAA